MADHSKSTAILLTPDPITELERDGMTVLHLVAGTERNEANARAHVEMLNKGVGNVG